MSTNRPDFDRLIREAQTRPRPISIAEAQRSLGALFDEYTLTQETLVLRQGADPALTPTAWIRVVRQAKAVADQA